jgi:uncharacterized protein (TIRG00374 family)
MNGLAAFARRTRRRTSVWQWLLLGAALLLLWLTLRSIPLNEVWAQLRGLQADQIALLVLANLLVLATFSLRWWILLYAQGYRLPYHKLMGYRLATFAVSYFTPGPHFGGEPLQVYLVVNRHGVPTPVSVAAVVLDKLIEMLFNFTFLALGALFVLESRTGAGAELQWGSTVVFSLFFLLPVVILVMLAVGRHPLSVPLAAGARAWQRLTGRSVEGPSGTESKFQRLHAVLIESERLGCHLFRQRPLLLAAAVVASLASWAAIVAEFWLMAHVLGLGLSLPDALLALLAARAAILLPLPAAVGALEASQALAMANLGLPPAYGISMSLLIRGRDVLLGLGGLGLAGWYLKNRTAGIVHRTPASHSGGGVS